MIGMVLITHGKLAEEFHKALEHIAGPQPACMAVCLNAAHDPEEKRLEILQAIQNVQQGKGVILLVDMFGSSAANLALSAMEDGEAEVIVGVNLPMLVKLAHIRQNTELNETLTIIQAAGQKYIAIPSRINLQ